MGALKWMLTFKVPLLSAKPTQQLTQYPLVQILFSSENTETSFFCLHHSTIHSNQSLVHTNTGMYCLPWPMSKVHVHRSVLCTCKSKEQQRPAWMPRWSDKTLASLITFLVNRLKCGMLIQDVGIAESPKVGQQFTIQPSFFHAKICKGLYTLLFYDIYLVPLILNVLLSLYSVTFLLLFYFTGTGNTLACLCFQVGQPKQVRVNYLFDVASPITFLVRVECWLQEEHQKGVYSGRPVGGAAQGQIS